MKKLITRILKYFINIAKRNKLIQFAFEMPMDESKFHPMGEFVDVYNNKHILYREIRDQLRPGWQDYIQKITNNNKTTILPKPSTKGRLVVERILPVIKSMGKNIKESSILEIGCNEGHVCYALSEKGATQITGTEYIEYKIEAVSETHDETKQKSADDELKKRREIAASAYTLKSEVNFIDDDICNSSLEPNSYDIVLSFDVFEHLHDPLNALKNIHRILKTGGISIQEYNPFFSLIGGHSLCTLDFFWGHVRLSEDDFLRYLKELRPVEYEHASSFYHHGINRMTLNDLHEYCNQSGMETESVILFSKEQQLRMLNEDILNQCKKIYPGVQINDLITPRVLLIQKKYD